MELLTATFLFILNPTIYAAESNWLCKEESSQRRDNSLYSCGVASGKDENEARLKAFDNAKAEFSKICSLSDDCRDHQVTVTPQRTACEEVTETRFRCYRLIVFSIGEAISHKVGTSTGVLPTLRDTPDSFVAFKYEQTEHLPKIRKGMPKKALLAAFGAPKKVVEDDFFYSTFLGQGHYLQFDYSGSMCDYDSACTVIIKNGAVLQYSNFKFNYTESLKDGTSY